MFRNNTLLALDLAGPHRISWARLLKRLFDIDMQHGPNCCAGQLKIIAAILERSVIEKIWTHLGLDPQPLPTPSGASTTSCLGESRQ